MRVVFMGTPSFALPSLRMLHDRHEVLAVYTRPDAAFGRGRRVSPSPVKALAEELGLPVAQPATLKDPEQAAALAAMSPDVIAVAAYGMLLPEPVLRTARLGCLNVHASLLPRWRGAAPIERAVLAGDDRVGVSIMLMEAGLDTGPFTAQASIDARGKSLGELTDGLARIGAEALSSVMDALGRGDVSWTAQDPAGVTYADKVTAADVALAPALTVSVAERRVRASSRHAPSRIAIGGRAVTVVAARPTEATVAPGAALCERGLTLGLADGGLEVVTLVPAGRSAMSAADYVRGAHLPRECTWEPA